MIALVIDESNVWKEGRGHLIAPHPCTQVHMCGMLDKEPDRSRWSSGTFYCNWEPWGINLNIWEWAVMGVMKKYADKTEVVK